MELLTQRTDIRTDGAVMEQMNWPADAHALRNVHTTIHTDIHEQILTYRQTGRHVDKQKNKKTNKHTGRQTQTDTKTDGKTCKQANANSPKGKETDRHIVEVTTKQECHFMCSKMTAENNIYHSIFVKCALWWSSKLLFHCDFCNRNSKKTCYLRMFLQDTSPLRMLLMQHPDPPPHSTTHTTLRGIVGQILHILLFWCFRDLVTLIVLWSVVLGRNGYEMRVGKKCDLTISNVEGRAWVG